MLLSPPDGDQRTVAALRELGPRRDRKFVAQNCGARAFFAAHEDTSTLRVFSWDETSDTPSSIGVKVARWEGLNGYVSRTPDQKRWLDRADPRPTGATLAGNEVWFAWGVDKGGVNNRLQPYAQIARIDTATMQVVENINLFETKNAICYAALATNDAGEVGVSYMIGGTTQFPSHVVGILTGTQIDAPRVADGLPLADDLGGHVVEIDLAGL